MIKSSKFDVIVIGAGAAGLMAAHTAGQRGKSVLLIEVSNKVGKKILMSGGGRCNFTNLEIDANNFLSSNPHFVKSALAQYSQWDFIGLVAKHGVPYHEKDHGQLFCDNSSKDILKMLLHECDSAKVDIRLNCSVEQIEYQDGYSVKSNQGDFLASSVIVASGGLSIPSLGGATGFGYRLAENFGLRNTDTDASLVPITLSGKWKDFTASLSGVSLPISVAVKNKAFHESLLFTHRGISGPAILQISNYWNLGETLEIDLLPSELCHRLLLAAKDTSPKKTVTAHLAEYFPKSLSLSLQDHWWSDIAELPLQEIANRRLLTLGEQINAWKLKPSGTEGYRTAEVTRGGVDVGAISSKTMQAKSQPGLFFVGEVLDVTGHLGGYNFQWAWSSGYVAGMNC